MIFPFTYPWIFSRCLRGISSILDVGCGDGYFMSILNARGAYEVTGVDLFGPYLQKAKDLGCYKDVVAMDVRHLSMSPKSSDCVVCSQVVEHLKKHESEVMLDNFERIATKRIVIGVPNGEYLRDEAVDGNDLQIHQSSWTQSDFSIRGYKVYGQSIKLIYGQNGLLHTHIGQLPLINQLLQAVSFILSPLAYFFPDLGAHIIAVKKIQI